MRTLLCVCTLSLIAVSGTVYAEPEEEQTSPARQVAMPAPSKAGTLVGKQKNPTPAVSPQAATKPGNVSETPEQMRKLGADWLKQCLQDWDAATHMTKSEWQRVCRRVAEERTNALIKQMTEQRKADAQSQTKK